MSSTTRTSYTTLLNQGYSAIQARYIFAYSNYYGSFSDGKCNFRVTTDMDAAKTHCLKGLELFKMKVKDSELHLLANFANLASILGLQFDYSDTIKMVLSYYSESTTHNSAKTKEVADLHNQLANEKIAVINLQNRIEMNKDEHTAIITEMKESTKQKTDSYEMKVATLSERLNNCNEGGICLRSEINRLTIEKEELTNEVNKLNSIIKVKDTKIEEIKKNNTTLITVIDNIEENDDNKRTEMTQTCQEIDAQFDKDKHRVDELEKDNEKLNDRIRDLEDELEHTKEFVVLDG